jgi:SOS response regulatory protein OraA/RecX
MPVELHRAYVTGLKLLATRELAEGQLRERLARRHFAPDEIDEAVVRLRLERALDDHRTALAYARTEHGRGRGRLRILRRLESMGVARDVARAAMAEVLADNDERDLVDRTLTRRLRHGESLDDPKVARRLYRYLMAQGFDAGQVTAALRRRTRPEDNDAQ